MIESNELLRIFQGFKIMKYEEVMGSYDWAPGKPLRLVRLVFTGTRLPRKTGVPFITSGSRVMTPCMNQL